MAQRTIYPPEGSPYPAPSGPGSTYPDMNANFAELYANSGGAIGLASVSATLGTGPLNDLGTAGDALALAGWVGGTTNRLLLTPATGGSTVNGLLSTGVADGVQIPVFNQSLTNSLIFAHEAGGSAAGNQFLNQAAGSYTLEPGAAATLRRVGTFWRFT